MFSSFDKTLRILFNIFIFSKIKMLHISHHYMSPFELYWSNESFDVTWDYLQQFHYSFRVQISRNFPQREETKSLDTWNILLRFFGNNYLPRSKFLRFLLTQLRFMTNTNQNHLNSINQPGTEIKDLVSRNTVQFFQSHLVY